jgi:tripartite-type tricarboxylate transporter receptor subunit TctC
MEKDKTLRCVGVVVVFVFLVVMGWDMNKSWAAEGGYPIKPIQVIICYPPGATDVVTRPTTEKLEAYFGQPIVFVFKPGGGGAVGASFVAKAKPDGYTLLVSSQAPIILSPLTRENLGYTLDDFIPICRVARAPYILSVKADSRWKNLKELIQEAKKNPGKLTFASAGVFSTPFLTVYRLMRSAGIDLNHVPVMGDTQAVTAVLGGHVDLTAANTSPTVPHLRSGALRALAVFDGERLEEFPDIPTVTELGYPVVQYTWWGFLAPQKTPEEVIKAFSKATEKVSKDHRDSIQERLKKLSVIPEFLNSEEFDKELKKEYNILKELIEDYSKVKK